MGIPEPLFHILREFLTAMAANMPDSNDVEEEEDDCVIFKGSPLYNSLLQSGSLAEELEVEQTGIDKSQKKMCEDSVKQQISEEKGRTYDLKPASLGRRWKIICKELMSWFLPDLSSLYNKYHETVIKELSASSSLEEDDRDFLHFYIQSSSITSDNKKTFSRISRLTFYIIPCLVSISAYQFVNSVIARQPLPWGSILLAAITPAVILEAFQEARSYRHRKMCRKELLLYEDFIRRSEKITSMVKKCLRLIQETELISRGFTLVSQRNPLSRLEGGQKDTVARQCPVLRKLLFTVARQAVLFFREMTKQLFDIHPLSKELDIQGSYLAYEPIQSYGPCLQTDIEDIEALNTITDGFSISALKGITHLLSLHQSEFIKALILVQQERFDKGAVASHVEELNIVESVSARLEEWTVSLKKSHDYHSCAWMYREPVTKTSRTQSNVEDIYVAVHSLDLHLQAALARVKCLSEHIQNLPETQATHTNLDDLLDKMQPIRAELESCKGCWEEGLNRIETVAGKNCSRVQESLEDGQMGLEEKQNTDKPAKTIEDYIIEDQVFEGYTDPDEVICDYEWEKPLTQEEKEKKRKEKEEALRMLSELKSVISVRAVETEKREKAAILKMYPDLKFSEKLCDTELTNQEESLRTCAQIATNQEVVDWSCDHMMEMPLKEKKDSTGSDNSAEKNNAEVKTISCPGVSQIDQLTNKGKDIINDKGKEFHKGDNVTSLANELKQNVIGETVNPTSVSHETSESSYEKDRHSVISSHGVRRLRKSDMLELSDSDLEEYPEDESNSEHNDYEEEDEVPRLGLPLRKLIKDDELEEDSPVDGVTQFRLPVLTLQERLETFSGANLGLTSELAEKAVAKSKIMGVMEETTFGGDVYGECSNSSDDDKDDYIPVGINKLTES